MKFMVLMVLLLMIAGRAAHADKAEQKRWGDWGEGQELTLSESDDNAVIRVAKEQRIEKARALKRKKIPFPVVAKVSFPETPAK